MTIDLKPQNLALTQKVRGSMLIDSIMLLLLCPLEEAAPERPACKWLVEATLDKRVVQMNMACSRKQ